MSKNSNPFYDPEDDEVDDDEFLRHPRTGNAGYMLPQHNAAAAASASGAMPRLDPVEQRRQTLMEKRREIEQRTVDSSSR